MSSRHPNGSARSRHNKPRRTQEQRRIETRRKLLDAAIRVLRESGFARFTIGDVASRAGLTSGAVQHHFPSIQDLLRGVVETVFPLLDIQVCDPAMSELAPSERVSRIVDVYWQQLYAHPDYPVLWELMFGTRGHDDLHELLKTMQQKFLAKAVSDLTGIFADIEMRSETALQLCTFIACQLRGLALLSLFEERRVLEDDLTLLKEAAAQLVANRTRRGYAARQRK